MKVHKMRVRAFCRFFAVSGSCLDTWSSDEPDMVAEPFREVSTWSSLASGTGTLVGVGVPGSSAGTLIGGTSRLTASPGTNLSAGVSGTSGGIETCSRDEDFWGNDEGTCRGPDDCSSGITVVTGWGSEAGVTGCSCSLPCFCFWRCFLSRRARRLAFFIADLVNFAGSCGELISDKQKSLEKGRVLRTFLELSPVQWRVLLQTPHQSQRRGNRMSFLRQTLGARWDHWTCSSW